MILNQLSRRDLVQHKLPVKCGSGYIRWASLASLIFDSTRAVFRLDIRRLADAVRPWV